MELRGTLIAAFALTASFMGLRATHAQTGDAAEASAPKRLLMHYMPWYEAPDTRGRWGEHWTGWQQQHDPEKLDGRGLPDIWSKFHPLIGPYDSTNAHVLECQLLQMKIAGIDGVIADWYGISSAADYPPIHNATQALFATAGRLGMEFAVCFEDRTVQFQLEHGQLDEGEIQAHFVETFTWMEEAWFGAEHYARVDGQPLVLTFGPIHVKDAEPWQAALGAVSPRPTLFALHHLWRSIGADGGFTWVHKDTWKGFPDDEAYVDRMQAVFDYTSSNPAEVITSVTPGFHDVYDTSYGYLPHRGGETLRESLAAAMASESDIAQLVTWNDYGEGTMFEPTHEFGYLFLEIVQEARAEEIGESFTFVASDLRLPARLFSLRNAGDVPSAQLDAISEALVQGDPALARELLVQAER